MIVNPRLVGKNTNWYLKDDSITFKTLLFLCNITGKRASVVDKEERGFTVNEKTVLLCVSGRRLCIRVVR